MKIKTSELFGVALSWAVSVCEGFVPKVAINPFGYPVLLTGCDYHDWSYGGPIMERELISPLFPPAAETFWRATKKNGGHLQLGATPLLAGMRCFVDSRLGDEVDVPDELLTPLPAPARPVDRRPHI
jgi:hypothetical protein